MPPPPKQKRIKYGPNRRRDMEQEQADQEEKEGYLQYLENTGHYSSRVIEALRNVDESQIDLDLALEVVKYICTRMRDGAILIFMPGWDTISKMHDMLMASPMFCNSRNYRIIPLHSMMPTTNQQTV